tara:strand:+ start:175 stop:438 length:264 start_codon:yes stop_codon:yes gene_type:complete
MKVRTKGEALMLVIELKRAIKGIDSLVKNQWYLDHSALIELRESLKVRLKTTEELIHLGELPDSVIEEWMEKTEDDLKLLGIKIVTV